jgi:phosphoglycolate phosphatase
MKKYKLIIFDVDGTLLDTREGVLDSVRDVVKKYNMEELPLDTLRTFIGPPIQNSLEKHYGVTGDKLQEMTDYFRDRYKSNNLFKAVPYDGIFDVMKLLRDRGIKIAVATYKREDYALSLLKHFGFDQYADVMHGADNENKLKKSDIIRLCISEMECAELDEVLMVGDTDNDAAGADKIGVDFLGVGFGFGYRPGDMIEDHPSIGLADTPIEIMNFIDR